jgi:XTP/dITP diphosphohydrolase
MKLVFATNNLNKLKEVQEMLSNEIELLSLKDIGCFEDIPETADTLEGNARIKANHISKNYGYDCFADDTGLEVSSLNGEPGVYSARYAGQPRNADNNMNKLLSNLTDKEDRSAQFRTIVTLNLGAQTYDFEGICEGTILSEKRGAEGFGYDPIFQPKGYERSFAEMSLEEKNKISHRKRAVQKLVDFLTNLKPQ